MLRKSQPELGQRTGRELVFTEHQPRALYRQFIHVSSHLILPIIPGGRDYNYSLLTDLETEARHRAKTPPGHAVCEASSHLWAPAIRPPSLGRGAASQIKTRQHCSNPRSLGTHWAPVIKTESQHALVLHAVSVQAMEKKLE